MRNLAIVLGLALLVFASVPVEAATTWIYTTEFNDSRVIRYNADTGASEIVFDLPANSNPRGIALDQQGRIYVGLRSGSQNIKRYDPVTGATINFTPSIGGFGVGWLDFDSDGNLLAAGDASDVVYRYNGVTGALIDSFGYPGDNNLVGMEAHGLTAYSADVFSGDIARYDLTQSPVVSSRLVVGSTIPTTERYRALGMTIGHNGNLFVANKTNISEFDINTGQYLGVLVSPGATDVFYDAGTDSYFLASASNAWGRSAIDQIRSDGTFVRSFSHGGSGAWSIDVIPEPSTIILLAVGGVGLVRRQM